MQNELQGRNDRVNVSLSREEKKPNRCFQQRRIL